MEKPKVAKVLNKEDEKQEYLRKLSTSVRYAFRKIQISQDEKDRLEVSIKVHIDKIAALEKTAEESIASAKKFDQLKRLMSRDFLEDILEAEKTDMNAAGIANNNIRGEKLSIELERKRIETLNIQIEKWTRIMKELEKIETPPAPAVKDEVEELLESEKLNG